MESNVTQFPGHNRMTIEQYRQERAKLARDEAGAVTRWEQELALLFERSGLTQEELAKEEGKGQSWVAYQLRFGRFLSFTTTGGNSTTTTNTLTERRFRAFWDNTNGNEPERFQAVVKMMQGGETHASAPRKAAPHSAKRQAALDAIDVAVAVTGKIPTPTEVRKTTGLGEMPVREALLIRKTAPVPPPPDVSTLSKSKQQQFDVALRAATKKLEAEFEARVRAEIKRRIEEMVLPTYNREREEYRRVIAAHKGVVSRGDYRKLLACLHPDKNQQFPEIFDLFRQLESVLVKKEEPAGKRPVPPPLPTTLAELLEREKKAKGA